MPVLKQQQHVPAAPDAIVLDLGDLARQAERLKQQARAEAQRIIAEAKREAQRLGTEAAETARAQGHAAGLEQGREEGRRQGRDEAFEQASGALNELQNAWIEAARAWEQQRQQLEAATRDALLAFTLEATRRIVHRVVEVDPRVVADQTAAALAMVWRSLIVRVHIHPDDRPAMQQAMPKLHAEFAHLQRIELVEDATVDRGGCVVHHGHGRIDARIGEQLDRLAHAIAPTPPEVPPEVLPEAPTPLTPDGEAVCDTAQVQGGDEQDGHTGDRGRQGTAAHDRRPREDGNEHA